MISTKSTSKKNRKNKNRGASSFGNETTMSTRTVGEIPPHVSLVKYLICPPTMRVKLKYIVNSIMNRAGTAKGSRTWSCNGLYDVDPLLGSTAIAGFTEWSSLYATNRVISCHVKGHIANLEAFPVLVSEAYVPATVAANAFAPVNYGNKFVKNHLLSAAGGLDRVTLNNKVNMAALFGSTVYWGDLTQFCGTVSTNPQTLLSYVLGFSSNSPLFVNGLSLFFEMEFEAEFFNPTTLSG